MSPERAKALMARPERACLDGGPAFPCQESGQYGPAEGMSLRAYYAGQALAGLTAATGDDDWGCGSLTEHISRNLAIAAVKLADDMLAALKGGEP